MSKFPPQEITLFYKYRDKEITFKLNQFEMTVGEFLNEHIKPFMIACGWGVGMESDIYIDCGDNSKPEKDDE